MGASDRLSVTEAVLPEWEGMMSVDLDVSVSLAGGSVLVQVGGATRGMRLTSMAMELIESREGQFGQISLTDLDALKQVQDELKLTASVLGLRIEQELARL